MAECPQNYTDLPTCSICIDVFREPVTLPCQHSYCRACLQMFTDQSSTISSDQSLGCTKQQEEDQTIVSCPVCRQPADLGSDGVDGLPTNIQLTEEILEKFQPDNKHEETSPACSICDEGDRVPAVQFCSTCCLLYCEPCLEALHPPRGALKRHALLSINDYLAKKNSKVLDMSEAVAPNPTPTLSCDQHRQPFSIYCVTCQEVICNGCLGNHADHVMRDVESASEKQKESLLDKTKQCEEALMELLTSLTGIRTVHRDVQGHEDLQANEVEKGYNRGTEALKAWRKNSLETLKQRHSEWGSECKMSCKDLQTKAEEVERLIQSSNALAYSRNVKIVQGSTELVARIDRQLAEITESITKGARFEEMLFGALERDRVVPRNFVFQEASGDHGTMTRVSGEPASLVKLLHITRPEMRFVRAEKGLKIGKKGSVVQCGNITDKPSCHAWTDACIKTGRCYWEVVFTMIWPPDSIFYCAAGVSHKGHGLRGGAGIHAWWIGFEEMYPGTDYKIACFTECLGEIRPRYMYGDGIPDTETLTFGLLLDSETRLLTIFDKTANQVIGVVKEVDVSQPLVPCIWLQDVQSGSARLVTGAHCTPPAIIRDILNN